MTSDLPIPPAAPDGPAAPFLSGPAALAAATQLIGEFGEDALCAAQLRAAQARARDNALHFCRWREVERMLQWLGAPTPAGMTRH